MPNQTQIKRFSERLNNYRPIVYFFIITAFATLMIFLSTFTTIIEDLPLALYQVILTDKNALCLDGSQASYYISEEGDPKKLFIAFAGGGWCHGPDGVDQVIESCYERSKTQYGSTKYDKKTLTFNEGVLSTSKDNNFRNWTRVYLKYCDGSGHQGTKTQPVLYNGTKLYFRGQDITFSQLKDLQKTHRLFSEATHVVVGGFSAGGLAAFTWANYIKDRVKVGKVWAMPDSGIFLDSQNVSSGKNDYRQSFKNLVKLVNKEAKHPLIECSNKYKDQPQKCMFAQNLAQFVKVPLLVIQSLYDEWSIENILNITCVKDHSFNECSDKQINQIEEYHKNMSKVIISMTQNNGVNGYWAPVCVFHCLSQESWYYDENYRIPQYSQNSIMKSVESWMQGQNSQMFRYMDKGKWPDNAPCAGSVKAKVEKQSSAEE